jgi:hypothetical protein
MWHLVLKGQTMKHWILALGLSIVLNAQAGASVTVVSDSPNSESQLGQFTATLTYSVLDAMNAQLQVQITNTSPVANTGRLVAFAFNNPGNLINSVSLTSVLPAPHVAGHFDNLLGGGTFNNSVATNPFGSFDIAASVANQFNGGGNNTQGLAAGETGLFTFIFGGASLNTLNEQSFLSSFNSGANANHDNVAFLVRYRAFANRGSDKVPGIEEIQIVPEASSLLVWSGLALVGAPFGVWCRRNR